jgi:hypothetical protein
MAATVGIVAQGTTPSGSAEAATNHTQNHVAKRSSDALKFRNQMRKLWEDHITWTRMFIVSAVAELPDVDTAARRLLRNQNHIGNAIKPFYGNAAGEALSELLREHILIAADLLTAAKNGDDAGVDEASTEWSSNAKEIADFLNAANPSDWPRSEMRTMMAEHLEWTLAEAVARLTEDWTADVKAYNRIHRDILHMADMLSVGIINQFPDKF